MGNSVKMSTLPTAQISTFGSLNVKIESICFRYVSAIVRIVTSITVQIPHKWAHKIK